MVFFYQFAVSVWTLFGYGFVVHFILPYCVGGVIWKRFSTDDSLCRLWVLYLPCMHYWYLLFMEWMFILTGGLFCSYIWSIIEWQHQLQRIFGWSSLSFSVPCMKIEEQPLFGSFLLWFEDFYWSFFFSLCLVLAL
jgi:hypothetical protein